MFKKVSPAKTKAKKRPSKKIPPHYAVKTAKDILRNKKMQLLLARLNTLAHISEDYWNFLYQPAIEGFIEYVQGLPAVKYEAFDKHNGLLILGLRRAIESLVAHRKNHSVKNLKPEEVTPQDALHTYAIFTAALFTGLGQIPAIYWVSLCNSKGFHGHRWEAMASNMIEQGTHYRYSYESINRDILANYVTPHIAVSLMPKEGFVWISSDKNLFEAWLAFLQNDVERGGLIAEIILPIEQNLLQGLSLDSNFISTNDYIDYVSEEQDHHFNLDNQEISQEDQQFIQTDQVSHETGKSHGVSISASEISGAIGGVEIGVAFIEWLKRGDYSKGTHRLVSFSQEGFGVAHPEAAIEFLKENPQYGDNPQKVLNALKESGLAEVKTNFASKKTGANMGLAGMRSSSSSTTTINFDPTLITQKIPATSGNTQSNANITMPNLVQNLQQKLGSGR